MKLLAYLEGRADKNTGQGSVFFDNLALLVDDTDARLIELENAGDLFDRRRDGRYLSYRVQVD
jgi:hypothetical protein